MTPERRLELVGLCDRATRAPWSYVSSWNNAGMPLADFAIPGHSGGLAVEMLEDDAAFIVTARTAVPELLAEAEGLAADLAALTAERDQHRRDLEAMAAHAAELQLQVSGLEERLEDMAAKRSDAEARIEELRRSHGARP